MRYVVAACFAMLATSALLTAAFVVRRRRIVDRAVGMDLTVSILLNGLAVAVVAQRGGTAVDLILLIGLLGFLGTVTVARFIERRGVHLGGAPPGTAGDEP